VHTADGGNSWGPQTSNTGRDLLGVLFQDQQRGFIVGQDGVIMRTMDGGATWTFPQSPSTATLWALAFVHSQIGCPVAECDALGQGTSLHTPDGGTTWPPQNTFTSNFLYGVAAFDPQTGVIVGGGGTLLRTQDGVTWLLQNPATTNTFFGVTFPTSTEGF